MTYCNGCADDQCEFRSLFGWICSRFVPKTNADRIRAMTDEELADFMDANDPVYWDRDTWLKWLKQEGEK